MALPLAGAGSAHAAIAGANPASTNLLPDLRSATVVNGLQQVNFCFDKQLGRQTPLDKTNFTLAGYRSGTRQAADLVAFNNSNLNCVLATFSNVTDLSAFSIAEVAQNSVQSATGSASTALGGNTFSIPDAVALNQGGGTSSQSGTRGHTTGPDLAGVIVDSSDNAIAYVFDQKVSPTLLGTSSNFHFVQINGAEATGTGTPVFSGNTVLVTFNAANNVNAAQRVYVDQSTVQSANITATATDGTPNPVGSAIVPGKSGATVFPTLVSAALVNPGPANGGNAVDFTFDQTIADAVPASNFTVYTSDGGTLTGTGTPVVTADGKTVRVQFDTGNKVQEYLVEASADRAAVLNPQNESSVVGAAPIGGNAGAFANGFTTGADAFSVAFDNASGSATITFDQRVFNVPGTGSNFVLLDADGNQIATASSVGSPGFGNTGPTQVTAQFTPQQLALGKSLIIEGNGPDLFSPAVQTGLGQDSGTHPNAPNGDDNNVTQALSPTATSASVSRTGKLRGSHIRRARHASRGARARAVRRAAAKGRALARRSHNRRNAR